jgi:hypothetical protein
VLDLSQLYILPARQSYIHQYGKIGPCRLQILQQLKLTDRVKRYDFCCIFLGKLADGDTIMNKLVFSDEATFHRSDMTPMDVFLWGFVKDSVYISPLLTTVHELKIRIREACANTDQEFLHSMWQEVQYQIDVA